MPSNVTHTWELFEIAPSSASIACAVFYGEHPPFISDIERSLESFPSNTSRPLTGRAINIVLTLVQPDYRVLSFSCGGQPYVYALIHFERREV